MRSSEGDMASSGIEGIIGEGLLRFLVFGMLIAGAEIGVRVGEEVSELFAELVADISGDVVGEELETVDEEEGEDDRLCQFVFCEWRSMYFCSMLPYRTC